MPTLAPSSGQDWNEEELEHIARLRDACEQVGRWRLECSHTDAGDPWCIVHDREANQTVLHIARIDRRYVLVFPQQNRTLWKPSMAAILEFALGEIEAMPLRP